jgi:hypothetical protein
MLHLFHQRKQIFNEKTANKRQGKFYQTNKIFYHTFLGIVGEKSANAAPQGVN